jgi:hypothetical protein
VKNKVRIGYDCKTGDNIKVGLLHYKVVDTFPDYIIAENKFGKHKIPYWLLSEMKAIRYD